MCVWVSECVRVCVLILCRVLGICLCVVLGAALVVMTVVKDEKDYMGL